MIPVNGATDFTCTVIVGVTVAGACGVTVIVGVCAPGRWAVTVIVGVTAPGACGVTTAVAEALVIASPVVVADATPQTVVVNKPLKGNAAGAPSALPTQYLLLARPRASVSR